MSVTIHRDLLAFLETVKAHTDDDILQLELADWLEKRGQLESERDRGTFILLQCQLDQRVADSRRKLELGIARPDQERELKEFDKLLNQANRLLSMHLASWLGAWLPWIREEMLRERSFWRRGLLQPSVVGIKWLEPIQQDPAALDWVDKLTVSDLSPKKIEPLARSPILSGLMSLCLESEHSPIGDDGARRWRPPAI